MAKLYKKINVYDASNKRLEFIFNEFEKVAVAFSGGKDSGVLLNLTVDYAKKINRLNDVIVFYIDYEIQYNETDIYVSEIFEKLTEEVRIYHVCLPFQAPCTTSMHQNYWIPWDKNKQDLWVREIPTINVINEDNCEFEYKNLTDYQVQNNINEWLSKEYKTCTLVGIRTDESYDRYMKIKVKKNRNFYKNKNWLLVPKTMDNVVLGHIIYDWSVEDVWIANYKFNWSYNKIYDLYHQAGLSIHQMRVASPFISQGQDNLKLYKVLDPDKWSKMIGRVNGVNFTALYGGTTAMGWQKITKPNNLTWEEYAYFLLDTLPEDTKKKYLEKLETSIKFWKTKGGVIEEENYENAKEYQTKIGTTNQSDKKTLIFEEYPDEITGKNWNKFPSFKRFCICIMKNDTTCKYMGFTLTKKEMELRKKAEEKWKKIL